MKFETIESAEDPRVADYRSVRDDERGTTAVFVAESRLPVLRLLEAPRFRTRSILLTPSALASMRADLERAATEVPLLVAEQTLLNRIVGYNLHRGCAAAAERPAPLPYSELIRAVGAGRRLVVVLVSVANPENVGAVFRNALAFGAEALLLCAGCSDPLYRKSIRSSMAATLRVPFSEGGDFGEAERALREAGFRIAALCTGADADPIASAEIADGDRIALVLGSEALGLSPEIRAIADLRLRIPMAAGVDSLNVATASGIALHHFALDLR
jgi:tRNA G18 (ribose-2'-O)-methylase SpoU